MPLEAAARPAPPAPPGVKPARPKTSRPGPLLGRPRRTWLSARAKAGRAARARREGKGPAPPGSSASSAAWRSWAPSGLRLRLGWARPYFKPKGAVEAALAPAQGHRGRRPRGGLRAQHGHLPGRAPLEPRSPRSWSGTPASSATPKPASRAGWWRTTPAKLLGQPQPRGRGRRASMYELVKEGEEWKVSDLEVDGEEAPVGSASAAGGRRGRQWPGHGRDHRGQQNAQGADLRGQDRYPGQGLRPAALRQARSGSTWPRTSRRSGRTGRGSTSCPGGSYRPTTRRRSRPPTSRPPSTRP